MKLNELIQHINTRTLCHNLLSKQKVYLITVYNHGHAQDQMYRNIQIEANMLESVVIIKI